MASRFLMTLALTALAAATGCGGHRHDQRGADRDAASPPGDGYAADAASARLRWSRPGLPVYYSSPAIAPDGTIYVGTSHHFSHYAAFWKRGERPPTDGYRLYAFTPDGQIRWEYAGGGPARGAPVIGADGTVYIVLEQLETSALDSRQVLHAVSANGQRRWVREVCRQYAEIGQMTPALGSDGTLYLTGEVLTAVRPDGTVAWTTGRGAGGPYYGSPAVGSDGTILSVFWEDRGQALRAFDPADGATRWTGPVMGTYPMTSSPSLAADGTVIIGGRDPAILGQNPGTVFAVGPDGQERWRRAVDDADVRSSASVDADGTIYVGTWGANDWVYAIAGDGTVKWRYRTRDDVTAGGGADVYSSPLIAADGLIYVPNEYGYVYAFNANGTVAWKDDAILPRTGGSNWSSFALADDGTLYVGRTYDAFLAIRTTSPGLSRSAPWPKFRASNDNRGRLRR